MKLDRTLIDSDHPPTPEELRAYAIRNDITTVPLPFDTKKATDAQNRIYVQAQKYFFGKYATALKLNGVTSRLKNLSSANPFRALEEQDAKMIAGATVNILNDQDEYDRNITMFFEIMRPQLESVFQTYASSRGRDVDDLAEDEIMKIVDGVADLFVETMMKLLQQAQGVPEIAKALKKNGAIEDFNPNAYDNHDKQNFEDEWYHLRTKIGAMLSFEGYVEKHGEDSMLFAADGDTEPDKSVLSEEEILEKFIATLPDSTDQEIVRMRYYKQMTQTEIATALGYQSQSAVAKRMAKIQEKFMTYTDLK